MKVYPTEIPAVRIVETTRHEDGRGFLVETFNERRLRDHGIAFDAVQENHSRSERGVVRGLHLQIPPAAQAKLVRVAQGRIFDVAVDVRDGSDTFGRWVGLELDAEEPRQLYVPPGFAHGFCVLSERADVVYLLDAHYAPEHERGLRWNDPDVGVEWPLGAGEARLNERDLRWPGLDAARGWFDQGEVG